MVAEQPSPNSCRGQCLHTYETKAFQGALYQLWGEMSPPSWKSELQMNISIPNHFFLGCLPGTLLGKLKISSLGDCTQLEWQNDLRGFRIIVNQPFNRFATFWSCSGRQARDLRRKPSRSKAEVPAVSGYCGGSDKSPQNPGSWQREKARDRWTFTKT